MNYKDFISEANRQAKRLSDKDLTDSIQKLIDKKVVTIEKPNDWFAIDWGQNSVIYLANTPKDRPKTWQEGFVSMVNGKGFGITVWDGMPKGLKAAIQAANVERRNREFDKGN